MYMYNIRDQQPNVIQDKTRVTSQDKSYNARQDNANINITIIDFLPFAKLAKYCLQTH